MFFLFGADRTSIRMSLHGPPPGCTSEQVICRTSAKQKTRTEMRNLDNWWVLDRTVGRSLQQEGLYVYVGRLDTVKFDKTLLIYSVSYFSLGGLEHCLGGLAHQVPPWLRDCMRSCKQRNKRWGWFFTMRYSWVSSASRGRVATRYCPMRSRWFKFLERLSLLFRDNCESMLLLQIKHVCFARCFISWTFSFIPLCRKHQVTFLTEPCCSLA